MEYSGPLSSPWLLWQTIDSAFPIGGFAHSGGLEAAVQLGFVDDADSLADFVRTSLFQTARLACPFVTEAWQRPADAETLSQQFDVLLVNDAANRASRALGMAVLAAGETIAPDSPVAAARKIARQNRAFAHLPVAFGVLTKSIGLDETAAVDVYLFQTARSLYSAAVRLGLVGPMAMQRLLADCAKDRDGLIALARRTTIDTAAQTAPTLDVLQSLHDRLYSRLFNS
ncbi:MAG: urease accessory UreF family protein [Tepidisphaeraceae bacterium]